MLNIIKIKKENISIIKSKIKKLNLQNNISSIKKDDIIWIPLNHEPNQQEKEQLIKPENISIEFLKMNSINLNK